MLIGSTVYPPGSFPRQLQVWQSEVYGLLKIFPNYSHSETTDNLVTLFKIIFLLAGLVLLICITSNIKHNIN